MRMNEPPFLISWDSTIPPPMFRDFHVSHDRILRAFFLRGDQHSVNVWMFGCSISKAFQTIPDVTTFFFKMILL